MTSAAQSQAEALGKASRVLVIGGILLVLSGMLLGEIYAIFISHVANGKVRRHWIAAVSAISQRDTSAVDSNFSRIQELQQLRGRFTNTHSHITTYGLLAMMLALLQPALAFREQTKRVLALLIIAGGAMQALFVLLTLWIGPASTVVSDFGGAILFAGVAGNLVGFLRAENQAPVSWKPASLSHSGSGKVFLAGGALLILLGMTFGFYYAWLFVTHLEPQQFSLLQTSIAQAGSGDPAKAIETIADYRGLQSRMGITAAAHSHVIEYGTLAILLAFLQPFVGLDPRWKARWEWIFVAAALAMGLCIYNATIFGLVSAGLADFFGVFLLLTLSANLIGVMRPSAEMHVHGMRDLP